jgi:hypothetical protein
LAADRGLDAEVRERLDECGRRALRDVPGDLARTRGCAQDVAVGERVLLVRLDLADVEQARLIRTGVRRRLDEERRRLVLPHDVGEVVDDVHGRLGCAQRDDRCRGCLLMDGRSSLPCP